MANRRVGGIILFKIDGEVFQAKAEVSYNINPVERTSIVGQDTVHGFSETPKPLFVEGTITDSDELDLENFQSLRDVTATVELANGKILVFRECFMSGDSGQGSSSEGEIQFRLEAISAEEVR